MKIHWDFANQRLMTDTTTTRDYNDVIWTLSDLVSMDIALVTEVDGAYVSALIPSGYAIKFALAETADLSDPLVEQGTFTLSSGVYTGDIDLSAADLITEIGTADTLACTAEFALTKVSAKRDATRFTLTIARGIIPKPE